MQRDGHNASRIVEGTPSLHVQFLINHGLLVAYSAATYERRRYTRAAVSRELRWWEGKGYPRGLRRTAIPLIARIVALAEVVEALSSKRVYGDAWPQAVVRTYITACAGSQFDPQVVDTFLKSSNGTKH
jgi:hypothetical protein